MNDCGECDSGEKVCHSVIHSQESSDHDFHSQ